MIESTYLSKVFGKAIPVVGEEVLKISDVFRDEKMILKATWLMVY